MKRILLLLASFVLTGSMMARQLTPDEALSLAMGKLNAAQPELTRAISVGTQAASVSLTHTEMSSQDEPLYYVYNIAEGGFIIASADDRASILLGYTDSGDFAGAQQNESFMAWLKDCHRALSHLSRMSDQALIPSASTRALTTSVQPLLGEIKWNQNAPYNLLTPMRSGKRDEKAEPDTIHAPTGCPATATAQVMMYYQWPATGIGSHTNLYDSLQTVDFSQSTYQWSKMLPTYQGGESEESQLAVAKLMYDLGCAMDMDYGYSASGTTIVDALKALTTYFSYDKGMRLIYRSECSTEEWNNNLQTELNEQRPVIFRANATSGGGHQFVIDGYDTNGLYHVNWGWGGLSNGYFDINFMDPDSQGIGGYEGGYIISQGMLIGVKPDVEGTSVAKPELVMTKQFLFDDEEQKWKFDVTNYGLGDFTGEIGIVMESPTGQVTKVETLLFDAEPISFYKTLTVMFEAPEISGPEYKLYPYYSDVVGGEIKRMATLYSISSTLVSTEKDGELVWDYDEAQIPDFTLDNVKVQHNYVGFDPQLSLTVSNAATSDKDYVGDIIVEISKKVDGVQKVVCHGYGQGFIKPGETKEIIIKCNNVHEEFEGKINEGEYMYKVLFALGGVYYRMASKNFKMVVVPPCEITYSDFSINKTEFAPDEELVASMTVTNTGGYDVKSLAFVIFTKEDKEFVEAFQLNKVDIEANSNETYTFKGTISYDPGEYIATFFVNAQRLMTAPIYEITVANPTAIDKMQTSPASDGKTGIYDLQGRPVQQMRKGELYIGKKKIVVVE